jgi:hypothetical protein
LSVRNAGLASRGRLIALAMAMETAMRTLTNDPRPQVGAPDPELETSPIVGEDDQVEVEPNVRGGACLFNGVAYRIGDSVLSGSEWLRCEAPGVWVREGEARPPLHGG